MPKKQGPESEKTDFVVDSGVREFGVSEFDETRLPVYFFLEALNEMSGRRQATMSDNPEKAIPDHGEVLLYQTPDGTAKLNVRLINETIWLSIDQMALLFGIDKSGISRHLKNIFATGELACEATVAKFATVQEEGDRQVNRNIDYYNLDAIISVGYRVNSIRGTQFRMWATQRLKEYIMENLGPNNDDWVWHYTSFDNVMSILDSGVMRATHYSFLNDRYEVKTPCKLLHDQLLSIFNQTPSNHPCHDIYAEALKKLESLSKEDFLETFFVLCFSGAKDSLPQWQGYAPCGGCAIGFNRHILRDAFRFPEAPRTRATDMPSPPPRPVSDELIECRYFDLKQNEYIQEFQYICDDLQHDVMAEYPPISFTKDYFTKKLFSLLLGIKDKAFLQEHEFRLAYPCYDANKIKFRAGKPYIELEFRACDPIRIMISPHGNTAAMHKSLKFLRAKIGKRHDIKNINQHMEILPSELSYQ